MNRDTIGKLALEGLTSLAEEEIRTLVLRPGVSIDEIQPGCDLHCQSDVSPYRGLVVYINHKDKVMLSLDRSKGSTGLFFALIIPLNYYSQKTGDLNWGGEARPIWPEDGDYLAITKQLQRLGM